MLILIYGDTGRDDMPRRDVMASFDFSLESARQHARLYGRLPPFLPSIDILLEDEEKQRQRGAPDLASYFRKVR